MPAVDISTSFSLPCSNQACISAKHTCVPVVPLTPRNRRSSRARSRFLRSLSRSWIHRQARLPTVVSCAGCRWV